MAFLGFPEGGPSLYFRLDPEQVEWNFTVHTRVFDTIGGRVIQVLGGALSDVTIQGSIGEEFEAKDSSGAFAGESWRLHESFIKQIREMMTYQARDAGIQRQYSEMMHKPARFTFGPKGWDFVVYIKAIEDPEGGSISYKVGRVNHKYTLRLFIVEDSSSVITRVGSQMINDYIDRISNGIGWRYSQFNGLGWENLDPYGDTWGDAMEEEVLNRVTGNEADGEVAGDGSSAPGGGVIPSGGASTDPFRNGGATGASQNAMRGVD